MKQFDQASAEIVGNVYDSLLQYDYLEAPVSARARPADADAEAERRRPHATASSCARTCASTTTRAFPAARAAPLVTDDVIYSLKRFADANVNVLSYTAARRRDRRHGRVSRTDQAARPRRPTTRSCRSPASPSSTTSTSRSSSRRTNPLALFPLAATPALDRSARSRRALQRRVRAASGRQRPVRDQADVAPRRDRARQEPALPPDLSERRRAGRCRERPARRCRQAPAVRRRGQATADRRAAAGDAASSWTASIEWVAIDRDNFAKMAFKDANGFHLKPEYKGKFVIYSEPDLSTEYFVFNMKDPLVGKNKALREAIAYALDTPAYIEQMYNGRGDPLHTLVPLGIAGSERDVPAQWYRARRRDGQEEARRSRLSRRQGPAADHDRVSRLDHAARASTSSSRARSWPKPASRSQRELPDVLGVLEADRVRQLPDDRAGVGRRLSGRRELLSTAVWPEQDAGTERAAATTTRSTTSSTSRSASCRTGRSASRCSRA